MQSLKSAIQQVKWFNLIKDVIFLYSLLLFAAMLSTVGFLIVYFVLEIDLSYDEKLWNQFFNTLEQGKRIDIEVIFILLKLLIAYPVYTYFFERIMKAPHENKQRQARHIAITYVAINITALWSWSSYTLGVFDFLLNGLTLILAYKIAKKMTI